MVESQNRLFEPIQTDANVIGTRGSKPVAPQAATILTLTDAVAESFFSTLEFECVTGRTFTDQLEAKRVVGTFIDGFYNPTRLHSTNGHVSPIEFEVAFRLKNKVA